MASQYGVDIEIALQGAEKITAFTKNLKALNKEVKEINKEATLLGKQVDKSFRVDSIQNYSRALNQAERALRNVASGTDAERRAVERVVAIRREANKALARQNMLLAQAAANQRQVIPRFDAGFGMQGPSLPKDFFKVQGPKLPPGFTEAGRKPKATQRIFGTDRIGAAVSAGAFPLLFGGGPGMALGGALGGAVSGATFGPAAIALQVLGGALDQFTAAAAATGQALNPLTADVNAVAEAAGYANTPFEDLFVGLENSGSAAEALRLAADLMAITVGTDGVDALRDFGADTLELSTEFQRAMAIMQSAVASLINSTGILQGIAGRIERFNLRPQIRQTLEAGGANAERLRQTLGGIDPDTGQREFTAATYDLMRKINEEKERAIQLEGENASLLSSVGIIAANNKKIAELNADLTNDSVFTLEKSNIMQKAILEKTKKGANAKLIDIERDTELLNLQNRRNEQIEAANDKAERASKRQSDAADRLARKQQRAIDRRIEGIERELERTDRLFNRTSSQLDDIINRSKDKVAFEREYAELIRGGSTPAAAKQAIELKKQLLELDRRYEKEIKALDAQLAKTELVILEAIAVDGVTDAIKRQIEEYNRLKDVRDGLPGKKENAEGAIDEALAPKSDRQRLLDYMDDLQGKINDMMDPVKQLTALSETLGSAFSESFRGIVDGSMTAREALANLFQRTADHFLDMAAKMIAAQLKMQAVKLFMSFFPSTGIPASGSANPFPGHPTHDNVPIPPLPPLPGKALGGAVGAGRPYMVGERGPELFVPGAQGNIVPNNAMGGANVTVNVDASGSSVQGDSQSASQLGKAIGAAVQAELIKQKRPGGLLTR